MIKKLILGLALVLLASSVASKPVNITGSSGLDFEMAGGEQRGFWVEFETGEGFSSDDVLQARLTVRNDELEVEGQQRVTGKEFDLSSGSSVVNGCSSRQGGMNYSVHVCRFNESAVEHANNVSFTVDSNPRLMPANYGFEFDLRSNANTAVVETREVSLSKGRPVNVSMDAGDSSVDLSINSSSSGNVTVETYSDMPVEAPDDRPAVVSAVTVNASGMQARGNITFHHSPDLADIQVYYLDGGEWTRQGVDIVSRGLDYVKAEVPHFSTYAAYGTRPDYDNYDESEVAFQPQDSSDEQDQDSDQTQNTDQTPDETDQQDTNDQNQQEQQQDEQDQGTGSQQQTPGQDQSDQPPATGLFTANPTGIAGTVLFILLVVAAVLQYTGKVDFRKVPEKLGSYRE